MSDLDLLAQKVIDTDMTVVEVAAESAYTEEDIRWAYEQKMRANHDD